MKVKVTSGYQVFHEGTVYTDGDTVDAPDAEAQQWVADGYAEEVKAPKGDGNKAAAAPKSSTSTSSSKSDK